MLISTKWRTLLAGVSAATLAVSLAACSSSSSKSAGGDKTIGVGFDSTLSGKYASYGLNQDGAEAYLKAVNDSGGINGYKFVFHEADNQYSAATAAAVARTLAANSLVILSAGTTPTQGIISVAGRLKTPMIAGANGELFRPAEPYIYGETPPYSQEALADARFVIQTLGIKNIAFAYENDSVANGAAAAIPAYVKSLGGQVLAMVPVTATTSDFSVAASKLQASGATAVVSLMGPPILEGLQKSALTLGYEPTWTGNFGLQATSYTTTMPASVVNKTYGDGFMDPIFGPSPAANFAAALGKYFPKAEGSVLTEQGWQEGAIVAAAVKIATQGGQAPTKDSINAALANGFTGQRVGALASVTYNADQHFGADTWTMFKLTPGKDVIAKQVIPFTKMPDLPQS